jgi:hypothetical protein
VKVRKVKEQYLKAGLQEWGNLASTIELTEQKQ